MSFFDDNGLFGNFFDLDGDGKTDAIEEATAFALFGEMLMSENEAQVDDFDDEDDEYDEETDW